MQIQNPILPGFNPDPSIVRVEDTYYIASSTFEWFPGVRIHASKDLVYWNLIKNVLDTTTLLDMKGNPSSGGGIWAPDLSYADGQFWLVYTDVKVVDGAFKDMTNYLTTAKDIQGPWSAPIKLNGVGFDASLFKDVGIIARVPLASGLLTGRYNAKTTFGKDDHRTFNRNGEAFDKGETFSGVDYQLGLQAADELKALFGKEDLIPYALRWVLMHEAVSTVILGTSKVSQLIANAAVDSFPDLTDAQMQK